jgi:carboxypeptidase D
MLVLAPFTLLVAAVAALQSPHRKVASLKHSARTVHKRGVISSETEPLYLNKKTESMSEQIADGCNVSSEY